MDGLFQAADCTSIILEQRLHHPGRPRELAVHRRRRKGWQREKLVILAADHPARRETSAGGDLWAMADRAELLHRIVSTQSR
ncbi:Cgl0159 family (beta/alpha)8-fold protein [Desmospora activa]|uniref:Cgl0159-like domain-containing protein n=1 Tax=Desmospora activa DSM 45169 TaxID=1121389 RepID=A0A2T4Z7P3_9BACL|nr:hypothetical protein [Desmospora activa]PTM57912.1 hypothetical protein C8J48_0478 [Desmospora activa DSM 45169]